MVDMDRIYRQYSGRVFAFLYRRCGNEELAQELNYTKPTAPKPVLVVRDRYGVHRFPLDELESVSLIWGEAQMELLESLKGAFQNE